MRAKIGRARQDIANRLYESSKKDAINHVNLMDKVLGNPGIQNKELRNRILRNEVPKANSTVSFKATEIATQGGGGANIKNQAAQQTLNHPLFNFMKNGDQKLVKKVVGKGKKSGIAVKNDTGVELITHEVEHAKGSTSKGLRKRITDNDPRNRSGYTGSVKMYIKGEGNTAGKRVGFKEAIKDAASNIKNSTNIIAEEGAASLGALRTMKKHGATGKELTQAAKNLKDSANTYVNVGKIGAKSAIGRVFDTPMRRATMQGNIII